MKQHTTLLILAFAHLAVLACDVTQFLYSPSRYYVPAGTYNFKFQNGEVKNVVITSGKEITVQMPK